MSHKPDPDIPGKANRILNVILIVLVFIAIRAWHLSVVQYETHVEQSKKPQIRSFIEPAIRGTIRDRFNIPLALNKMQYDATLIYAAIRKSLPQCGPKTNW